VIPSSFVLPAQTGICTLQELVVDSLGLRRCIIKKRQLLLRTLGLVINRLLSWRTERRQFQAQL
jgi:hypothetical protein